MKKNLFTLSGPFTVIAAGIIVSSCMLDPFNSDSEIDPVLASSTELEDFIIAATDLDQALKVFEKEIGKVDFTKLETVILDGREVTYLPEPIPSLHIEQKSLMMQEKRAALFNRFPQFASMSVDDARRHMDQCIKQSERVADDFLKKGINIYQPLTRFGSNEHYYYDSMSAEVIGRLHSWCMSSDFVEVAIIRFADGRVCVNRDPGNTAEMAIFRLYPYGGRWYYPDNSSPNNEVSGIAHTHTEYGHPTSSANEDDDWTLKSLYPGISHSIYFNGSFWSY